MFDYDLRGWNSDKQLELECLIWRYNFRLFLEITIVDIASSWYVPSSDNRMLKKKGSRPPIPVDLLTCLRNREITATEAFQPLCNWPRTFYSVLVLYDLFYTPVNTEVYYYF